MTERRTDSNDNGEQDLDMGSQGSKNRKSDQTIRSVNRRFAGHMVLSRTRAARWIPGVSGRSRFVNWCSAFTILALFMVPAGILSGNAFGMQAGNPVSADRHVDRFGECHIEVESPLDDCGLAGIFIENGGQYPESLEFVSEVSFGQIGLGKGSIYYHVRECPSGPDAGISYVIRLDMVGANQVDPVGLAAGETLYNYFLGTGPSEWTTGLRGYSSVVYRNVWDGIDIMYHGRDGQMKYDIILSPGADPRDIRFEVVGMERLEVRDDSLVMVLSEVFSIIDSSLMAYQEDDLSRVDATFTVEGSAYGFHLGEYDPAKTVIVDPNVNSRALNFSTYVGGSGDEDPTGMDLGPEGDVYVCGYTQANDFPTTPGAYQMNKTKEWITAFVFKLARDGTNLTYCTYIGGSRGSFASDISVSSSGTAFVCGYTDSDDFPLTSGAYDDSITGTYDCFVLELNSTGSGILHSTFFGGGGTEGAPEMDVDVDGIVYTVLTTDSTDLPTTANAFQPTLTQNAASGTRDLAVFAIDLKSMSLKYSTYLGGTNWEFPSDLRCGTGSMVFVGGYTCSTDLNVTSDALMSTIGGDYDGFLFALNTSKGDLVYCTYFGGSMFDAIYGIDIDPSGRIFACGRTDSSNLRVTDGAFDNKYNGNGDAFIFELSGTGGSLIYSSFVGGTEYDSFVSMEVDTLGDIHTTGETRSGDYPVIPQALQTSFSGGQDALYSKFTRNFSAMAYSTFLGGTSYENMNVRGRISIDNGCGEPVLCGGTTSSDFPTTNGSFDIGYDLIASRTDVFVTKLIAESPPGMPLIRSVESGDSFVRIFWDTPAENYSLPLREFEILRGRISGRLESIGTSGLNRTYNDTDVRNGVLYYYAVRGVNDVGYGLMSLEVTARPGTVPCPPRNLSAVHGNARVLLNWDAPEYDGGFEITSYQLLRKWDVDGSSEAVTFNTTEEQFEDKGLKNGIEYSYTVTARNDLGESPRSGMVSAIPRTIPSPPMSLIAISGPGHSLLIWEPPASDGGAAIIGYNIFHITEAERDFLCSVDPDVREFNDTGLKVGLVYRYEVTVLNSEGESDPSEEAQAHPRDRPSPPENFTVVAADRYVVLSWDPPVTDGGSSLLGYRIHRKDGSDTTTLNLTAIQTSFTDRTVSNGRTYSYSLSSYNRLGESRFADWMNATPKGRPSPPIQFRATAGDGFALLSWDMPSDGGSPITSFVIRRECYDTGNIAFTSTTDTSYNDTGLENGVAYGYMVQSVNEMGGSDYSEFISVVPVGLPDPPTSLGISASDGLVSLTWDGPSNDGGSPVLVVRIYRTADHEEMRFLAETGPNANGYVDEGLRNGIEYGYALRSVNALGEGGTSEIVRAIPSTVPGAPGHLGIHVRNGGVLLQWSAPDEDGGSPVIGYRVFKGIGSEDLNVIADIGSKELEYVDSDVIEGSTYRYVVTAINANGQGSASVEANVTFRNLPDGDGEVGPTPGPVTEARGFWIYSIMSMTVLIIVVLSVLFYMRKRKGSASMRSEDQPE